MDRTSEGCAMRSDAILVKTTFGNEQVERPWLDMPWRQRALLVAMQGELTVFELRQRFYDHDDVDALLEGLLRQGLIISTGNQFAEITDEAIFDAEELARALLRAGMAGMRRLGGFVFGLSLRAARTREQLVSLLPEFQRLLAEGSGEQAAWTASSRIGLLIGDGAMRRRSEAQHRRDEGAAAKDVAA